ncbi:MAG TPA: ABC transporter substrate-binding protein [Chloroflexota bacterium]|nr:ABC transporter substrate-binding protein [Chloroflexota bacterium]
MNHWPASVLLPLLLAACAPATQPTRAPADASAAPAASAMPAQTAPGSAADNAAAAAAAAPPPLVHLNVATQHLTSDVGMYVAQERGYFAEQGLDVEFADINTSQGSIPPLAAGQLDVGVGSMSPGLFNAIARGIDVKLVATKGAGPPDPSSPFAGSNALVVAAGVAARGAIQDYADLRGKSVSLPDRGSTMEMTLTRALERGGLTIDDVDLKLMPFADTLAALANGSVDAAVQLEPYIAQGQARGILVVWKRGAELIPGQQATAVVYGPTMAQMPDNAGGRLMVAYTRGLRDYNDALGPKQQGREQLISILIQNTALKDRAVYDQLGWGYFNPDCSLNADSIAEILDWYVANGYVPQRPDLAQAIDNRYCAYAVQQLGPYQP